RQGGGVAGPVDAEGVEHDPGVLGRIGRDHDPAEVGAPVGDGDLEELRADALAYEMADLADAVRAWRGELLARVRRVAEAETVGREAVLVTEVPAKLLAVEARILEAENGHALAGVAGVEDAAEAESAVAPGLDGGRLLGPHAPLAADVELDVGVAVAAHPHVDETRTGVPETTLKPLPDVVGPEVGLRMRVARPEAPHVGLALAPLGRAQSVVEVRERAARFGRRRRGRGRRGRRRERYARHLGHGRRGRPRGGRRRLGCRLGERRG